MNQVIIDYTNYKGQRALRLIEPIRIWFGNTTWHPEDQWLLRALDCVKAVERDFAFSSIHNWGVAEVIGVTPKHPLRSNTIYRYKDSKYETNGKCEVVRKTGYVHEIDEDIQWRQETGFSNPDMVR